MPDDSIDHELRAAARAARSRAYAPYTKFDAGAAVLATDGTIHTGAIVENISLGLAMCAERVALFNCATSGARPAHVLLEAPSTDNGLTWPCGACLQVALELGGDTVRISTVGVDDHVQHAAILDLLPNGPYRRRTGI